MFEDYERFFLWIAIILLLFGFLWLMFGKGNSNSQPDPCSGSKNEKIEPLVKSPRFIKQEPSPKEENVDNTPKLPEEFRPTAKTQTGSIGERICRKTLEEIYHVPFPSTRPNFLKNPETGRNLELDCYNENLKLACEYSGIQHYVWPNFTGQSYDEFVKQIRRDMFKVEVCDKNGIYLITVPYNVRHQDIPEFIKYYLPESVVKRNHLKECLSKQK